MANVKVIVTYDGRNFKVQMPRDTSVSQLQFKLRKYLKMKPTDAMFIFWKASKWFSSEQMFQQGTSLAEIQEETCMTVLECSILLENCFGF